MSYPNLIQTLIIEDRSTALYDAIFENMIDNGEALAPPIHAYSHNSASVQLQSDRIIHLVILDLRLPDTSGQPAEAGIDHGLDLLKQCTQRNKYPIPALLVISGHLDEADQLDLQGKVNDGFFHGRVLVKSRDLEKDIINAVNEVKKYVGVGIHIRDAGAKTYPTLGPREEDLLRRCVLNLPHCNGIDLKWWTAEYDRGSGHYSAFNGWTKTLTGRFLFDGDTSSRLSFFKFAPAAGAHSVIGNAKMMKHKLAHIKVIDAIVSGNRSLLITEKAGNNDEEPISLADYLFRPAISVLPALPQIVREISNQVRALGNLTEDRRQLRELLWQGHSYETLETEWKRYNGDEIVRVLGEDADPLTLFSDLSSEVGEITFNRQSFRHGDLNATNIAIDTSNEGVSAYIFDASGCAAGPNIRDLASLEVSALLHQPSSIKENLVERCSNLYADTFPHLDFGQHSDVAINTFKLISELRSKALDQSDEYIYALMVFDNALIQLGGLAFGPSCNKIANPREAAWLAAYVARWLRGMGRVEFPSRSSTELRRYPFQKSLEGR